VITLYGIPNCDTVKKARSWLEAHGITYSFHDYKKQGASVADLMRWCEAFGWEKVLNRAGTTFRKLDAADTANLTETKAITLMQAQPSLIKRPIVEGDGVQLIGFQDAKYQQAFKS
jgi:arsenate reductase (glutaredoxin)